MSIKFHCDHCGKKIEAPDNTGGKWGKCPNCHNRLYIPQPDAGDELKLAPVDENDELRQRQLLAETFQITQAILEEKNVPEQGSGSSSEVSEEELTEIIIRYLRQMFEGDLDAAKQTAQLIAVHRRKAKELLDQIATGEPSDPQLMDIPQQVLSGLIRNLRTRIS
jgi:hypothetical protein